MTEMTDISGFTDDRDSLQGGYMEVRNSGNSVLGRMMRHGRWWAVKSVGPDMDPELGRLMLRKEFDLLLRTGHPNVARAVEFAELPGLGWSIVMEWVDGEPLDRYLESRKPGRSVRGQLGRRLMEAVAHLHARGVTHRDLKPSNILVDDGGNPCIIDLGLGDDAGSVALKSVTGTAGFTAPEVTAGSGPVDWKRADVYALGLMLRQTGGGAAMRLLARRCLRRDPRRRPADGGAALRLLRRIRAWLWSLAAVACVAMVGVAAWAVYGEAEGVPERPNLKSAASLRDDSTARDSLSTEEEPVVPTAAADSSQRPSPWADETPRSEGLRSQAPEEDTKGQPADLNIALWRAMDIRDSLRYAAGRGEPYDTCALDRIMDSWVQKGLKTGWSREEADYFRSQVSSRSFYGGGYVTFMQ